MPSLHLHITGKVQGVFFRASAKKVAESIGLKGWIRNTGSSAVEALITGSPAQLLNFKDWCKSGPPDAKVDEVIVTELKETFFPDFEIKH